MRIYVRRRELAFDTVQRRTPIFFPSVSSVKTNLSPLSYIRALISLSSINAQFLVSAFDLAHMEPSDEPGMKRALEEARAAGMIVLLDSGNYESYWKDARGTWTQSEFHKILNRFDCSLAFGFDEQFPPDDIDAHLEIVSTNYARDCAAATSRPVIPIIHGDPENLPILCVKAVQSLAASTVAVPERRLGIGIFERCRTMCRIREALDKSKSDVGVHLLGTGNPTSIALYSMSGADSFDGLEWCQTIIDFESGLLFHSSHYDFFRLQTEWGESDLPTPLKMLAHNLEFYGIWIRRLHESIEEGKAVEFCRRHFSAEIFSKCKREFGWGEDA